MCIIIPLASTVTEVSRIFAFSRSFTPGLCRSCCKHDGQNPNQRLPSLASRGVGQPPVDFGGFMGRPGNPQTVRGDLKKAGHDYQAG